MRVFVLQEMNELVGKIEIIMNAPCNDKDFSEAIKEIYQKTIVARERLVAGEPSHE